MRANAHGTIAKTARQLAALCARSSSTVLAWLRRPDWPFGRRPPWDAVEVLAWAQGLQPDRAAAAHGGGERVSALLEQAKAPVWANRALLLRLEYEERAHRLHNADRCRERRLRQILAVRTALMDLPQLAPDLEGRPREGIERVLQERVDHMLTLFGGEP